MTYLLRVLPCLAGAVPWGYFVGWAHARLDPAMGPGLAFWLVVFPLVGLYALAAGVFIFRP